MREPPPPDRAQQAPRDREHPAPRDRDHPPPHDRAQQAPRDRAQQGRRSRRPPPLRSREPQRPAGQADDAGSTGQTGTEDGDAAALDLLSHGTLEVEGRLIVASNATMYCSIQHAGAQAACVYKPVAGERPLWDFPVGTLAGREVAAYHVSAAAGWNVVPPTVYRDGPFGPGMCQLWIETDEAVDVVALARSRDNHALREMAVFDAVVNNADRKIGHLLPDHSGHLFGCDHGVCFGEDYKLRTVLWQWRGRRLPAAAVEALDRLQQQLADGDLRAELDKWLTRDEVEATRQRVELLLQHKVHPFPPEDWPAVPWPPV
jgi:uncharacterized repeat protein (TIGR03843 family)